MTSPDQPGGHVAALAARLATAVVVPVIRAASAESALELVARCVAAGLDLVELTTTTPAWTDALDTARRAHPGLLVGVGTVRSRADAVAALDGGAGFLVSPCPAPEVRLVAGEVPFVEGGMTVGEVLSAAGRGIAKLFPAHVGGPALLRSIRTVAPAAQIVPTGGISIDEVPAWLEAGALAVGIGRNLLAQDDLVERLQSLRATRRPPDSGGAPAGPHPP